MKLTESQLRKIIREYLENDNLLNEYDIGGMDPELGGDWDEATPLPWEAIAAAVEILDPTGILGALHAVYYTYKGDYAMAALTLLFALGPGKIAKLLKAYKKAAPAAGIADDVVGEVVENAMRLSDEAGESAENLVKLETRHAAGLASDPPPGELGKVIDFKTRKEITGKEMATDVGEEAIKASNKYLKAAKEAAGRVIAGTTVTYGALIKFIKANIELYKKAYEFSRVYTIENVLDKKALSVMAGFGGAATLAAGEELAMAVMLEILSWIMDGAQRGTGGRTPGLGELYLKLISIKADVKGEDEWQQSALRKYMLMDTNNYEIDTLPIMRPDFGLKPSTPFEAVFDIIVSQHWTDDAASLKLMRDTFGQDERIIYIWRKFVRLHGSNNPKGAKILLGNKALTQKGTFTILDALTMLSTKIKPVLEDLRSVTYGPDPDDPTSLTSIKTLVQKEIQKAKW